MTELTQQEDEAIAFFGDIPNLIVQRVTTCSSKTPDFLIDGDKVGYVVEVKSRCDAEDYLNRLRSGRIATTTRAVGHSDWGMTVAKKARRQMGAIDVKRERLWVLWLSIACMSSVEAMWEQAIGTLYGVRQIAARHQTTKELAGTDCLYVVPGIFDRFREFDCALVAFDGRVCLCVNEFSAKLEMLKDSILYNSFGVPFSREVLESKYGYFSITEAINRKDESVVCNYLQKKYTLVDVFVLNMKSYSATAYVPRTRKN